MHASEEYLLKKRNACYILYFVQKLLYFVIVYKTANNWNPNLRYTYIDKAILKWIIFCNHPKALEQTPKKT